MALATLFLFVRLKGAAVRVQMSSQTSLFVHTEKPIQAIRNGMRKFKEHMGVQYYALCALSNFLSPLCDKDGMSAGVETVQQWANPCLSDIMDILSAPEMDVKGIEQAINLFWNLTCVCKKGFLRIWTDRILKRLITK
jgi:hypothetical protein